MRRDPTILRAARLVPQAIVFELLLGLLGALLALGLEDPLRSRLQVNQQNVQRGVVACAPMLAMLVILGRSRWPPLARLRRKVREMIGLLFQGVSAAGLAAVSLAAGLGEEILFRGALQPLASGWTSPTVGLISVSLIFGLLHAASTTYFILATVVGFYFGWLAQAYDDLVAPIIAHALYDFAALLYLRRLDRSSEPSSTDPDSRDRPPSNDDLASTNEESEERQG